MAEKIIEEQKDLVLQRVPPGDRWSPVTGDTNKILPSLTDGLEYIYQRDEQRDFHLAALDGKVYAINQITKDAPPPKTFNLYGE
tara:strand:- start:737 stop:988 length:252 start_codon:yes stop_codon:yes gene_type:complete